MSVYRIIREPVKYGRYYVYKRRWGFIWDELRSGGIWRAAFGSRQSAADAVLKQDPRAKFK